jgi:capping protein beta
VETDPETSKKFILCDYNRDGDSYRSPWSNAYYPPLEDGFKPSPKLRQLEVQANSILDVYRRMYFDTGESSAYFFNTDEDESRSFGACYLIHKDVAPSSRGLAGGVWDSIHVFEVNQKKDNTFEYKLTTTVLVSMDVSNDKVGKVDLSGSMTQQSEQTHAVTAEKPHLTHMGKMLEDMELRIRNAIEIVYIQKTREIVGGMRIVDGSRQKEWAKITASLNAAVLDHGAGRKVDG